MDGLEGVLAAVDYVRKKQQEQQAVARRPVPAQPPRPAAPAPAPPAATADPGTRNDQPVFPSAPHPAHRAAAGPLQAMFEDGNSLLRALVASEILGPPIALR